MAYIGKSPAVAALTASDITDGIISNAKLAQDIMSAESELTSAPASTDEFLLSDAGVLKRIDASLVGKGKLLQIQSTLYESSSEGSTTSTSYVDSGITDSITPSATSSKIFVMATINGHRVSSTAINSILNIERDIGGTTAVMTAQAKGLAHTYNTDYTTSTIFAVDSPSTTSAITYTVQFKSDNSSHTAYCHRGTAASAMILMEIGA